MDATQSYVKIHNMTLAEPEDFAFDYDTRSDDLLTELVPDLPGWGDVGWMGLTNFEYDKEQQIINLTIETKWDAPAQWLQNASNGDNHQYFENKLITMATVRRDEALVTGVAVMDGETLQNKPLLEFDPLYVARHYDDEQPEYDIDNFDDITWDAIAQFVKVCEQFYLDDQGEGIKNDY